jgi:hypothetical protein
LWFIVLEKNNQILCTRQVAAMKRRCNALILQGALALLLVVQSVAWRGGPDAFQKDIGEYVSSLTKSNGDENWNGDNNEDEHKKFWDEVNADVGDVGESYRGLKGKKGKKTIKAKKMKAPKTPAPTSPSTGAPTCPPTRFLSSPTKKSQGKGSKKNKTSKSAKSLAVCITPNPTAIPTASPTCSPTLQPTAAPTASPTKRPKKQKKKKGSKGTKTGKGKKRKRVLVSVVVFDTCQESIFLFALFSNSPRFLPNIELQKKSSKKSVVGCNASSKGKGSKGKGS